MLNRTRRVCIPRVGWFLRRERFYNALQPNGKTAPELDHVELVRVSRPRIPLVTAGSLVGLLFVVVALLRVIVVALLPGPTSFA